jgi:hypothetical protein
MYSAAALLTILLLHAEPGDDKGQMQRWMAFYANAAGEYKVYLGDDEEAPLEFNPVSILQYTNPERERGQHGAVFVWTYRGRPEAIGTIWSIRNRKDSTKRRTAHEFHSLSSSPLWSEHPKIIGLGGKGKMPQWRPNQAGIELSSIPGAPQASTSKSARLAQMRSLARGFDAIAIGNDGRESQLRLLPKPLVRYESEPSGVVDGALFTMVLGTDPELLLLIELRQVNGTPTWQFAAARSTGLPLRLRLRERTVWQCEKAQTWVGNQPYFFCVGVSEHDADQPAQRKE